MKKNIILLLGLSLSFSILSAQTWQEKLDAMERRVQQKVENQQRTVDLKFANQMRRVWKDATISNGIDPPPVPKPVNPQIYDPMITPKSVTTELVIAPEPKVIPRRKPVLTPKPAPVVPAPTPEPTPELSPEPAPRADATPRE